MNKNKLVQRVMTDWAVAVADHIGHADDPDALNLALDPSQLKYTLSGGGMDDYFYGGSLDAHDCSEILGALAYDYSAGDQKFEFTWPTGSGTIEELLMNSAYYAMQAYLQQSDVLEYFADLVEEAYTDMAAKRTQYSDDY